MGSSRFLSGPRSLRPKRFRAPSAFLIGWPRLAGGLHLERWLHLDSGLPGGQRPGGGENALLLEADLGPRQTRAAMSSFAIGAAPALPFGGGHGSKGSLWEKRLHGLDSSAYRRFGFSRFDNDNHRRLGAIKPP
ncbi:MAG TPA: hypothetical protein VFE58_13390 [Tepidisphaeraceae bacterium]|jgi:hypothetical protein|nr:hypothetical protein [Tepidisphaeraceae bacterium]